MHSKEKLQRHLQSIEKIVDMKKEIVSHFGCPCCVMYMAWRIQNNLFLLKSRCI